MALNREEYVCETWRGLLAVPIALQLADELHPAHRFAASLEETLYAECMRFGRGPADAIDDRIDLEPLLDGVKRGVDKANLGPDRSHDELLSSGAFHRPYEIFVLPGVDRSAVN